MDNEGFESALRRDGFDEVLTVAYRPAYSCRRMHTPSRYARSCLTAKLL